LPLVLRRAAFWFFVNGDFFGWGALFAGVALWQRFRASAVSVPSPLWSFLRHWRWYFAVCGSFFMLVNFYRYTFSWGDSNKFILFLNLGLALLIAKGASLISGSAHLQCGRWLWRFLVVACVLPYAYELAIALHSPMILLFTTGEQHAAEWLQRSTRASDLVLTASYNDVHFVSALAGRPTLAGINAQTNPYRQDDRPDRIRRVYEGGDFTVLPGLQVRYVCICRRERLVYTLHPVWREIMGQPNIAAFTEGGGPDDFDSVYIFPIDRLHSLTPQARPKPTGP